MASTAGGDVERRDRRRARRAASSTTWRRAAASTWSDRRTGCAGRSADGRSCRLRWMRSRRAADLALGVLLRWSGSVWMRACERGVGLRALRQRVDQRSGAPGLRSGAGVRSCWRALLELRALRLELGVGGRAGGAGRGRSASVSTTAMTGAGQLLRLQRDRSGDGERGERRAENDICSSECGPYVEGEELGVVARLAEQGAGDIDPERPERRVPVDAEADRKARARRIAEEDVSRNGAMRGAG